MPTNRDLAALLDIYQAAQKVPTSKFWVDEFELQPRQAVESLRTALSAHPELKFRATKGKSVETDSNPLTSL